MAFCVPSNSDATSKPTRSRPTCHKIQSSTKMTLDPCTSYQFVSNVLNLYNSLSLKVPPAQYTILASFILSQERENTASPVVKIISLSTGSKCLPGNRLSTRGDVLNDSHAEVLARRGAIRWFLEEIGRAAGGSDSEWICRENEGRYRLRDGVEVNLYVSTLPCKSFTLFAPRIIQLLLLMPMIARLNSSG